MEHVEHNKIYCILILQFEACEEEMNKSWGEIGEDVGLEVVADEEVEQNDEDREVENILKKGKGTKRKLATGTVHNSFMSDTSNSVQYSTHLKNNIYYNAMLNMSYI